MQVDREVVLSVSEPPGDRDVVGDSRQASASWDHDEFIDVGITFDDRRGIRFHGICEVSVGIVAAEGTQQRRREYHVPDWPQPDQQNAH
jgi:hypothetical protein